MADYNVEIAITANGDVATRNVKKVGDELQGLEGKARRGFQGAEREGRRLEGGLRNLQTTLIGLGTAFVAQVGIQGVMALREVGAEAVFAEQRFQALVGGPEAIGDAMDMLRQKTGGAVNDMRLQTDAAGLMLTGLAKTAEEAGDLIALGLQLGGEQGVDALSRALKNNSIEMLDNLGISAAAVRELRDQYTAAGMDSADAFARATLEIGRETAKRLGDAAEAGITAWSRVKTWFENEFQNVGEGVATFLEQAAQDLITAIEAHNLYWETIRNTRPNGVETGGMIPLNNPDPNAPFGALAGGPFSGTNASTSGVMTQLQREHAIRSVMEREAAYAGWQRVEQERQITAMVERQAAALVDVEPPPAERLIEQARGIMTGRFAENAALSPQLQRLAEAAGGGYVGEQRLFSPQDLAFANDVVGRLESFYATYENSDIIDEEALAIAKGMAESGREWAGYIEKGAEAYRNMTPAQAFGQGVTNPLLAGLGDDFLGLMKGDLDDDTFQRLQDALGLRTGAETSASLRWRDEGLPALKAIYEQFGQEAALEALDAYERGARAAALTGSAIGDPMALMQYLDVGGGELQRRQATMGWTPAGMTADQMTGPSTSTIFGGMIEEVDALTGKVNSLTSDSLPLLAGAIMPAADELGKVRDLGGEVQGVLDVMSSKEYPLKFALTAGDQGIPVWLKELIRTELAVLVRNNGGSVPGADPRARANTPTRIA